MRPIHALLLVIVLAGVVAGAFFLVRSESGSGPVGPGIGKSTGDSGKPSADGASSALDVPPDPDAAKHDRAKVTPAPVSATTSATAGIRGRVVDPDSRPVAGATVYAGASNGPMDLALDEIEPDSPWFKRVQGTTDTDGRFTLQPEAKSQVRIAVRAAGFAPYDAEKTISGSSADFGDLKLDRGAVLQGRVVDSAGRGVEGAQLHRVRGGDSGLIVVMGSGNNSAVLATTDAGGSFRIDQIAVGPFELLVTSQTHPDKRHHGETDRPGQVLSNLVIELEPGFDVAGRIVGAPAGVLAQLDVRASPSSGESMGFGGARRARVRDDGSFTIGGCREGQTYRVVARPHDREFMGGTRSEPVDAKAGDRDVVLKYKSETALVFQVVDADTGRPVETLAVEAGYKFPMPLLEEGTTKKKTHFDEGRVRFPALPQYGSTDANGQLRIESAGYEPYERKDMHFAAGVDNDLGTISLRRAALVLVTVVEASTGAPIAGAKVSLNELAPSGSPRGMMLSFDIGGDGEESFSGGGAAHRGVTDAQGKVSVSSLPGKSATLTVRHAQHATWKSAPIELPVSGDHSETVQLLSGGTVLVEVLDAAGKPVAGLSVDHRNPGDAGEMTFPGMPSDTITDGDGHVTFAHLAAGKHLFRVRTNGGGGMSFGAGTVVRHTRRVGGGEDPMESEKGWTEAEVIEGQAMTVKLAAPAQGSLTGRVRETGKPLAGATVRAKTASDDGPDFGFMDSGTNATTSSTGEYTITGLAVGDYTLTIVHPSRSMPTRFDVAVKEGSNTFDADLTVAIVEGRITGEDDKPLANVKVRAEHAAGEGKERGTMTGVMVMADTDGESISFGDGVGAPPTTTDADGRYKLRGVTPGVGLNIVASAPGAQTKRSERIELAPDQTRTGVNLVLKLGATVEVRTRRPDGTKASGCIVHARAVGIEDAEPKTQFVGASGRVTFTGLQPGRWKFTCDQAGIDAGPGAAIPDQEIEVKVGPPVTVTFDVPS